ncbi:MAG TPA: polysaccharide deacetylase family protein [Mycobacteriales bacterium]
MGRSLTRAVAARLPRGGRRAVRRITDRVLAPVGSLRGAHTRDRVVALTYDDGPDPEHTPAVLAALARAGVRATFFPLVYRAERHPDLVRAVLDAGHEIGLHGIDHSRLTSLPADRVAAVLTEGRTRLEAVTGRPVRYFRPPYGSQTLRTRVATRRAGLDPVVWGPSARDWVDGPAAEVAGRAMDGLHPGAVVLLHDGFEVPADDPTPAPTFDRGEVTCRLIDLLDHAGYRVTTVGGLERVGTPWRTAWFRP